jgi:hypothetical protein
VDVFSELARLGSLIRQLQGALQGNVLVSGHVTSTGTGISARDSRLRNGVGDYTLTFNPAFRTTARVFAMQGQGPAAVTTMKQSNAAAATASTFRLVAVNAAGALADADFWFIATG